MTMILIISTFKSIVCEVLYETLRFDISIISLGSRNRIIVRLVARCDLRNCAKKDRKNFDKISSNFDIDSSNRSFVQKCVCPIVHLPRSEQIVTVATTAG